MGRRIYVHQCPVCNYYIESELTIGGSGISPLFLRNHYELAACHTCQNLISVFVPNTPDQQVAAISEARRNLVIAEAEAMAGDVEARQLLPDLREALDNVDESLDPVESACEICGSTDLQYYSDLNLALLDAGRIWLSCPRCAEGRLLIESAGEWV